MRVFVPKGGLFSQRKTGVFKDVQSVEVCLLFFPTWDRCGKNTGRCCGSAGGWRGACGGTSALLASEPHTATPTAPPTQRPPTVCVPSTPTPSPALPPHPSQVPSRHPAPFPPHCLNLHSHLLAWTTAGQITLDTRTGCYYVCVAGNAGKKLMQYSASLNGLLMV